MFIKKKLFILVVFSFLSVSLAVKKNIDTTGYKIRNRRGIEIGNNQVISGTIIAYPGESIKIGVPISVQDKYHGSNFENGENSGFTTNGITIGNNNVVRGGVHQELEPNSQSPYKPDSGSGFTKPIAAQPSYNQNTYKPEQQFNPGLPNNQAAVVQPHTIYDHLKIEPRNPNNKNYGNKRVIVNRVEIISSDQISGNVCIGEGNYINGRLIQPVNCKNKKNNEAGNPLNTYQHVSQGQANHHYPVQTQPVQHGNPQPQYNHGIYPGVAESPQYENLQEHYSPEDRRTTDGIAIGDRNKINGAIKAYI